MTTPQIGPKTSELEVLFEDEHLIAINKPAGLPSQSTPDPKRMHALQKVQDMRPNEKIFLVHRIDKDTSGVLLFSKSNAANKVLTEVFKNHLIEKTYLCLTKPNETFVARQTPLTPWTLKNHVAPVRDGHKSLMRMVVVKKGGWVAETDFKILEVFKEFFLIQAKPKTGRTHQIRIHLASQKIPILGDFLYGGKSTLVPRLMLHAERLQLQHPITKADLLIKADLPKDFKTILDKARQ